MMFFKRNSSFNPLRPANVGTVTIALVLFMSSLLPATVFALTPEQRAVYKSGNIYFDVEPDLLCSVAPSTAPSGTLPSGSSVYMLGDSITNQSRDLLETAYEDAGFSVTKINSDPGRAITYDSGGGDPTGLEAVDEDSSLIADSDAVVIALGTNSGNEDLNVEIPNLIDTVRETGFSGVIYWVNLFYTSGSGPDLRNSSILEQSRQKSYSIIDLTDKSIELHEDGVHPTSAGTVQFVDFVVDGVVNTPTTQATTTNSQNLCVCGSSSNFSAIDTSITWGEGVWGDGSDKYVSGVDGPYTIEQWAIHVLSNIARKAGIPENQMVTENKVVSMIAWAKAEGGGVDGHNGTFNPLNTKSQYSDIPSQNEGNASTDSNSQGYTTFDDGVEAITRALFNKVQKRIGSALINPAFPQEALIEAVAGDFEAIPYGSSNSSDVVNNLEDIYPGDQVYAALSITGFDYGGGIGDRELYVDIKRDTLESVRNNYADYAGKILDGSPSGTPAPLVFNPGSGVASGYSGGSCANAGGGNVNTDGYSFPLEPQTKAGVSGVSVDQTESTHHDNTDAFDLFGTNGNAGGEEVYAIYSGTIQTISVPEPGWCYGVQLRADDSYFYFYGHLNNVTVSEGQRVNAGDLLGYVAEWTSSHDCNGSSGAAHLHIDRGCVIDGEPQVGGYDDCRDPEFIPLLSKLYEELP